MVTSIPACRKTMRTGKNIGTLTLSILKSINILKVTFYSHSRTPSYKKIIFVSSPSCLICKRVFFYSAIGFLYYSFTTELLLSLIYIKGFYPSAKTFPPCGKSSSALLLWWRPNSYKIATRIRTLHKGTNNISDEVAENAYLR